MWSTEIENILLTSKNFLGCFPMNELPPFPRTLPSSLIVNTDFSTGRGEHWLALILKDDRCLFFDSFGVPLLDETLIEYLSSYYDSVTYSNVAVQDFRSEKCGEFCILFIKNVKDRKTFRNFLSKFNTIDLLQNDFIVNSWLYDYKKINFT